MVNKLLLLRTISMDRAPVIECPGVRTMAHCSGPDAGATHS